MRRESSKTFGALATLAAVLYVTVVSSTLCCISDVVFLCSQCTGNQVCVRVFLLWNAFDVVVTFICDIALHYLVKSVTDESYRALQVHAETTSEDTMPSLDYMQGNLMERYRAGSDSLDTDYETTTEGVPTRRQPSFPRRVMAFVDKINSKSSLPQIFLATIFKVLVLIMIKQYSDQTPPLEPGSSDSECSSPSHMSTSQIAAWKAAYAQRSSTLHTIQERTHAEVQASCAGEAIRTPRSVAATPFAKAKTAPEVRLGPASPKEPSSTQRRSCERSSPPPSSSREDKGSLGSLDANHETIKPGEQCFNCFSVLENSQSLAQGNRLRVSLASESAKTVSGLAVLAAVLYVMIFSSTLSCISDVVFICFQCTGNQNCFKVFLIWNAIDILITFVCDVALYYMVQSVTSEGYKVTQTATDTEEEKVTASSWDYAQATLMENFPSDPEVGPEETPTEDTSASSDSNPQKVIAFTETLRLKPSLSYIFLAAVFKGMVLVTFQQNTDHGEVGGSSCPPHEASSSSVSRIAVWKAQYAQHRSRLETIRARALELQSASPDLQLDLQQNPPPITERAHAPDPAKPTLEPHSGGSLSGQEDVSANVGDVTDENADIGASPSMKRGESEGSNLSSKIKNELRHHKEVDAEASKPKRAHLDGIENNVTKS
ncbi:uncharacterized protein LOC142794004 [Rhipicephalus microplus]|uniref:uncharacterized protein LOC142794004 n=1 Tax=Rhipicephalus microplus TaxID=6941 RepID=UPI003F6BAB21